VREEEGTEEDEEGAEDEKGAEDEEGGVEEERGDGGTRKEEEELKVEIDRGFEDEEDDDDDDDDDDNNEDEEDDPEPEPDSEAELEALKRDEETRDAIDLVMRDDADEKIESGNRVDPGSEAPDFFNLLGRSGLLLDFASLSDVDPPPLAGSEFRDWIS